MSKRSNSTKEVNPPTADDITQVGFCPETEDEMAYLETLRLVRDARRAELVEISRERADIGVYLGDLLPNETRELLKDQWELAKDAFVEASKEYEAALFGDAE